MTSEFKKIKDNEDTRYVLETATAGATSAGVVATAPGKKRSDSILAQEKKETPKPRNFVAKNAKMGGAGQHKDKKKAAKQGDVKHKNKDMDMAEGLPQTLRKVVPGYAKREIDRKMDAGKFGKTDADKDANFQRYKKIQDKLKEQGVSEGERTMSRAAKGNEKYGKDGMKALAKAGREGASEKKLDAIRDKHDNYNEGLEDPKDNPCWTGYKPVGTKKKAGKTVPNCVPKESLAEGFNGEYDDEAGMAHNNLLTSARAVKGLLDTIEDRDNLPEWVQEKIAKAEMMLVGVWDYLQSQKEQGINPQQGMKEGLGRMRSSSSAYDRDYASSVSGMGRGPDHRGLGQELAHETNNYAVAIDGRTWKVFADQRQAENIARSLKAKGKNATVHPTGENPSESVAEVAPPGWEKTVKAMKKHDNIDNPFALAWSMKNKGYKSHKKESADPYFESLRAKVEELAKK